MTADPLVLLPEIDRATARLLATARKLDDADLAAPSRLPGWTRGHVLAHLARNADGCVNLLTWARTGIETPQYASDERRDADIETGAGDVFHGAFCHALLRAGTLDEAVFVAALRRAAEVAAESCRWFGTREWMLSAA